MRPSIVRSASVLTPELAASELKAINALLPQPYWSIKSTANSRQLEASYKLKTFVKTWEFLNEVAVHAHKLRHHPTITTTYNSVHFAITTHDAGNDLTLNDTKLAMAIHTLFADDFAGHSNVSTSTVHAMDKGSKIINELTKR